MAHVTMIGRTDELAALERCRHDAHAGLTQLVVMFGRRRVGKTFLLRHFAESAGTATPVAYFPATREAAPLQRRELVAQLASAGIELPPDAGRSWAELLEAIFEAGRHQPLVVIVDEAPYLVERDRSWPSVLQRFWDAEQSRTERSKLLLVLNGSAISTMTSMISSKGSLYGRPTATMRIEPFTLPMSHELLGAGNPISSIEAHAACGGYPLLLARWDPARDASANLAALASDPFSPLVANASSLLLDIADTGGHHIVLGAIGRGASKLSEISARAGHRAEHALDVLSQAGLIARRVPIGESVRKNLHYELTDGYLRFWFAIVDRNIQFIESGQGLTVLRRTQGLWTSHVAATFEREARAHAARLAASGAIEPRTAIGEWWTDSGVQAQIDIVGTEPSGSWSLAGEAKWAEQFTRADLDQLTRALERAGRREDAPTLASWSQAGPSEQVRALRPEMLHFTAADMVKFPDRAV